MLLAFCCAPGSRLRGRSSDECWRAGVHIGDFAGDGVDLGVDGLVTGSERWEPGDVVLDAGCFLWVRASARDAEAGWPWAYPNDYAPQAGLTHVQEGAVEEAYPQRPLVLLVRNGQPVTYRNIMADLSEAIQPSDRGFVRADDPETTRYMEGWDDCRDSVLKFLAGGVGETHTTEET